MNPLLNRLKNNPSPGLIVKTRAPDEKPEQNQEDDHSAAIESCASALISAIHSKDTKAVANALADAFEILDATPHEEGPHEPHSYDSQNIKAAE